MQSDYAEGIIERNCCTGYMKSGSCIVLNVTRMCLQP